jgi:hypothetical protein
MRQFLPNQTPLPLKVFGMTRIVLFGLILGIFGVENGATEDTSVVSKPTIEKIVTDFEQPLLFAYLQSRDWKCGNT